MKPITIFTFGYWGWGNATRQLVRAFDAAEKARGYAPPRFVDLRYSRSVRAVGFRQSTFADLVGQSRYWWLKGLGNRRISARRGRAGVEIADPAQARCLLDEAVQAAGEGRRLVAFCACEYAKREGFAAVYGILGYDELVDNTLRPPGPLSAAHDYGAPAGAKL